MSHPMTIDAEKLEEALLWASEVVLDAAGGAKLATLAAAARELRETRQGFKEVNVWRVESCFQGNLRVWQSNNGSRASANRMADYLATDGHECISVTGPHKQRVPA